MRMRTSDERASSTRTRRWIGCAALTALVVLVASACQLPPVPPLSGWGDNSSGQVGDGTTTERSAPVTVDAAFSVVSAGAAHTAVVRTDGTLWEAGSNTSGQQGDGTVIPAQDLAQVGTATNWRTVSSGQAHTMAVRTDGTLWAWGDNNDGELGDGTTTTRLTPTRIGTDTNWQSVSAGGFHTIALKTDGSMWSWGRNGNGVLGFGANFDLHSPTADRVVRHLGVGQHQRLPGDSRPV